MGKTTRTITSSAQSKEKTTTGALKSTTSNTGVQKKKSRSCSTTRRSSVLTDLSNVLPANVRAETSDDGEDLPEKSSNDSRVFSNMFKHATRISKTEVQCNECSKV